MARQLIEPSSAGWVRPADFADGARAITPMVIAVVPFGVAVGAVAARARRSPPAPSWRSPHRSERHT